jgi:hypothetical protein
MKNILQSMMMYTLRKMACQRGSIEMINPFDQDSFNMVSLCAAIDILPNNYGRVNQLGIFNNVDGIITRTAMVEEQNGFLTLLKTQPVGAPGAQNKMGKRKVRSFTVPHIPLDDVIMPSEFSGVRAFGQTNQVATLASTMNKHLQAAKDKFSITLEHMKIGALKGIILDADGSTLFNLFTEFDITPVTVDFALDVTSPLTDVANKCREVLRNIEDKLQGEIMTEVRALVSAEFFDALIAHPNVEKFFLNWQAAAQISGADPRKGFKFGGITFEEYRGVATNEEGDSRRFIASGEGHAFPMGTMNTFKQIYSPADFIETVNTPGIELYVKQVMEPMGKWIDLHIESNPLPLCCRPAVLIKLTV